MASDTLRDGNGFFLYSPSHILPAVFSAVVGISLILHTYQNFRYKFWRVTFWMFWGGTVYVVGWILRCISSYHPANLNVYIAQTIFIYAGPPIYSAAAYNLVGRTMSYMPMHATLNPNRVMYFFVYLGALVEGLTAAGAAKIAKSGGDDTDAFRTGGTIIAVAIVLQAVVESGVVLTIAIFHRRCARARMLPRNVHIVCLTLYGTSTLVLLRCIFRAVEAFTVYTTTDCVGVCDSIVDHEWYLYALEMAPMVIFTYWLNILHPGRYIPSQRNRFLDHDGKTERLGPGWTDKRSVLFTFIDPIDLVGMLSGETSHDKFWLQSDQWPICEDGSFANGTASNASRSSKTLQERMSIMSLATAA